MSEPDPLSPVVAAAWGRVEPGRRGPKPGLTLEQVVDAAIRIADDEGLSGVSMARVAQALGFTTMSLYRYVRSKDDLLLHMGDRAIGAPPRRSAEGFPWREGLAFWTRALMARQFAHPWVVDIPIQGPPLMPHDLEWMDWALEFLGPLPLEPLERISTISMLSVYARTEVSNTLSLQRAREAEGRSPESESRSYQAGLEALVTAEALPHLRALVDSRVFAASEAPDMAERQEPDEIRSPGGAEETDRTEEHIGVRESDTADATRAIREPGAADSTRTAETADDGDAFMFDFGLQRILDGLERHVERLPQDP